MEISNDIILQALNQISGQIGQLVAQNAEVAKRLLSGDEQMKDHEKRIKAIEITEATCPAVHGSSPSSDAWWHKAVIAAIYAFAIMSAVALLALLSSPDRAAIVGKVVGQ